MNANHNNLLSSHVQGIQSTFLIQRSVMGNGNWCSSLDQFRGFWARNIFISLNIEDHKHIKWIDKTPDEPSDPSPNLIEESDRDKIFRKSTSGLVPEEGKGPPQLSEDDESLLPILLLMEHPSTFLLLNLMMLLLPLMMLQLMILAILMNLMQNTYSKAQKSGNANLAVSEEVTSSPVTLDPSKFNKHHQILF